MKILFFGNSSKESGGPAQVMKSLHNILVNKYEDEVEILDVAIKINNKNLKTKISKFDLIHIHELWSMKTIKLTYLAEKLGIPYLFTFHGVLNNWSLKKNNFLKKIFLQIFKKQILLKSSAFHFLNELELLEAKEIYQKFNKKTFILQNGIKLNNNKNLKEIINISNHKTNFLNLLFLGRIHSKKGLIPLIDAMKLAKEEKFNVNLNIVGPESSHCDYLKTVVKKYKIENSVKFLPAVYEMSEKKILFNKNDYFILPSYDEADSVAVKEALSNNLPIIVTKECKIQYVEKEEIGYLISHNPRDILKKLINIKNNSNLYSTLQQNSSQYAHQNFDIFKITERYRNNLIDIISGVKYSDNWI